MSPHSATRKRSVPHWLLAVLVVAAAYAIAGRLALLLTIAPGYASPVWPSAGMALAAMLDRGYSIWPGILLGSLLVNVWKTFDASDAASILTSLRVPSAIAAGAVLQAIVGAALVRRYVGYPTSLTEDRDIVKFLLLGGPVSCFVSATVGVTSLVFGGLLAQTNSPYTWWTWWAGDTVGVLTFAPLILLWATTADEDLRRRRISVSLPFAITFALAVALFMLASAFEQQRVEWQFRARVKELS